VLADQYEKPYFDYPNDAVHLACALRGGCDVLLAWDDRFVKVQHPTLRIEEPRILGQHLLEFPTEDI
jgi:predicted nucleic acid-binding protein